MASLLGSATASAQAPTGTARPYQGLFGGAGVNATARQIVNLSVSFAENFDDNNLGAPLDASVAGLSPLQTSGFYPSVAPTLDIALRGRQVQFAAAGGSDIRYYRSFGEVVPVTHFESATLTAQFTNRTSLFVTESIAYTPASLYSVFPALAVPAAGELTTPAGNYTATDTRSLTYAGAAGLTRTFAGRGSLSLNADFRNTEYINSPPNLTDLRSYDVGGTYSVPAQSGRCSTTRVHVPPGTVCDG